MAVGKYSPICPHADDEFYDYKFNCYGKEPRTRPVGVDFDEKLDFANYDDEGYDSYGYSSFDADGNYVGIGNGIDRDGMTERDYFNEHLQSYNYDCDCD